MGRDEDAERLARGAPEAPHRRNGLDDDTYNEMVAASNAVLHLIDDRKLDEAEHAAQELQERFPSVCDGYARLGLLHELRGSNHEAINCYQKVIALVREHPEINEPVRVEDFQELIDRLQST